MRKIGRWWDDQRGEINLQPIVDILVIVLLVLLVVYVVTVLR